MNGHNPKKRAKSMRPGEGESLAVMGCGVRFLCNGDDTGAAWSLFETVLPKGLGPPPHHHPWDECYFVVSGRVKFTLEGAEQQLEPGAFVYTPANVVHGFSGLSDEPARVLIFDAPAHSEGFFIDTAREVRAMPQDLSKVPAIGQRHGITFLVPQ
jgi:quercetin dioxygenase-like cupin family protein